VRGSYVGHGEEYRLDHAVSPVNRITPSQGVSGRPANLGLIWKVVCTRARVGGSYLRGEAIEHIHRRAYIYSDDHTRLHRYPHTRTAARRRRNRATSASRRGRRRSRRRVGQGTDTRRRARSPRPTWACARASPALARAVLAGGLKPAAEAPYRPSRRVYVSTPRKRPDQPMTRGADAKNLLFAHACSRRTDGIRFHTGRAYA
jgi:hypothetical protein